MLPEIIAIGISGAALFFSYLASQKAHRLQEAQFYLLRANLSEGRITEWPSGIELHGIHEEALKREGVKLEQLLYLINSLNVLFSWSDFSGTDAYEHLKKSHYRQRMFEQTLTRKVWGFARNFFPEENQQKIDRYLREKYPQE